MGQHPAPGPAAGEAGPARAAGAFAGNFAISGDGGGGAGPRSQGQDAEAAKGAARDFS